MLLYKVDDFFSNVTYLNKIKYYDYSKAILSRAGNFLDNVKYTLESNSMQLSISYCYSLGGHTTMMQYETQIINREKGYLPEVHRTEGNNPFKI